MVKIREWCLRLKSHTLWAGTSFIKSCFFVTVKSMFYIVLYECA